MFENTLVLFAFFEFFRNLQQKNEPRAMRHSEKTVLKGGFTPQHRQKALKYGCIPSFFAVVAKQIRTFKTA